MLMDSDGTFQCHAMLTWTYKILKILIRFN